GLSTKLCYGREIARLPLLLQRRDAPARIHGLKFRLIRLVGLKPIPHGQPVKSIDGDVGHEADARQLLKTTSVVGGSRRTPSRGKHNVVRLEIAPICHPTAVRVFHRIAILSDEIVVHRRIEERMEWPLRHKRQYRLGISDAELPCHSQRNLYEGILEHTSGSA